MCMYVHKQDNKLGGTLVQGNQFVSWPHRARNKYSSQCAVSGE